MIATSGGRGLAQRLWPGIRRFGALRLGLLIVGVAAFVYLWLQLRGRFAEATVWQVPLVLELLILSLPWRVVSAGMVARFFLIGFGPVFLATVVSQSILVASPLDDGLAGLSRSFEQSGIGNLGSRQATIWAPITEEIWKIVPLLVVLAWGRTRLWSQGGPLDFAILAAATGAGLGLAENLFQLQGLGWSTPESALLGLGVGNLYVALVVNPLNAFPVNVADFDIGYQGLVSILVPSVRASEGAAVWPGHGIMPMAFGVALGWAAMARRRSGRWIALLVPIAVLGWSVWDHFVANWYRAGACTGADEPTLCTLSRIDLNGAVFPLVAIGLWALAMVMSRRVIAHHGDADSAVRLTRTDLSAAAYRSSGPTWPLRFAADLVRFVRLRNRVAYAWVGLDHAKGQRRGELADEVVDSWLRAGVLAWRLRGMPLTPPPA
jgi:hypothetical protein